MKSGDRIMVYDSPGFPLAHYLYATVLTPSDAGALVVVDHPGNPSHGSQKFVPIAQIMRAGDAKKLEAEARQAMAIERDSIRRKSLSEQILHHQFVATQLAE